MAWGWRDGSAAARRNEAVVQFRGWRGFARLGGEPLLGRFQRLAAQKLVARSLVALPTLGKLTDPGVFANPAKFRGDGRAKLFDRTAPCLRRHHLDVVEPCDGGRGFGVELLKDNRNDAFGQALGDRQFPGDHLGVKRLWAHAQDKGVRGEDQALEASPPILGREDILLVAQHVETAGGLECRLKRDDLLLVLAGIGQEDALGRSSFRAGRGIGIEVSESHVTVQCEKKRTLFSRDLLLGSPSSA